MRGPVRGRLIFPFLVILHRLDRAAMTQPASDGWHDHASGLDPDFKEPVRLDPEDEGLGEPLRRKHLPVEIPCQIEPRSFERFEIQPAGACGTST